MIERYEVYNLTRSLVETTDLDQDEAAAICNRLNATDVRTREGDRYRFAVQPAGFLADATGDRT